MNTPFTDEDRKAVLKSAKAQPFLVRGLISVAVLAVVSAALGLFTITQIRTLVKQVDARDIRNDAEAAFQRQILHDCLLPALPGQHKPEPKKHVHMCYDQTLGAVLAAQTKQGETVLANQAGIRALAQDATVAARAGKASSDFLNSCFADPKSACAQAQAKNQEFIQRRLDAMLRAIQSFEFQVTGQLGVRGGPTTPFEGTAKATPPNSESACLPPIQLGETGIGQGVICRNP